MWQWLRIEARRRTAHHNGERHAIVHSLIYTKQITLLVWRAGGVVPRLTAPWRSTLCQCALINTQSLLRLRISSHKHIQPKPNPPRRRRYNSLVCSLKRDQFVFHLSLRVSITSLSFFRFFPSVCVWIREEADGFPLIRTVPIECAVIRTGSAVKNCDHHSSNCFWHFGVWRADSCSNSIWPRIGFLVYTAVHIKMDLH